MSRARYVDWTGGPHDGHVMHVASSVPLPERISAPSVTDCETRYVYRLVQRADGVASYEYEGLYHTRSGATR